MRRALVAALLLAVPVFAGFECEVSVEGLAVGDACVAGVDDPVCQDSDILIYCSEAGVGASQSCATQCASVGTGSCVSDILGYGWCECESCLRLEPQKPSLLWPAYPRRTDTYLQFVNAVAERVLPHREAWNRSHGDVRTDALHALFSGLGRRRLRPALSQSHGDNIR